jgi:hypothetical protein
MAQQQEHEAKTDGGERPDRAGERPGDETGDKHACNNRRAAYPDGTQVMRDESIFSGRQLSHTRAVSSAGLGFQVAAVKR